MTTRACAQCGRENRLIARGLCRRCYAALWRAGKLDRHPADAQLGRPRGSRTDWRALAEARKGEIDRLRARIKELEAKQ